MEKYRPYLVKPNRDTGSPRDFDKLREGYQLVEHYRETLEEAERAPMYYAAGYNEDGEPKDILTFPFVIRSGHPSGRAADRP